MMSQAVQKINASTVSMVSDSTGSKVAPSDLDQVMRFADVMSTGDIALPKHLRGNKGACLAVTMQALQWEMNPFAVASKSYQVNGVISYEAQLISAVINTRSGIKGRLKYVFSGEGDKLTCTVTGILDDTECTYTSPEIRNITPKNSPLWKSDTQQQLGYYSARAWARRYCPEVMLGVYDREEAEQIRDITPRSDKPTILTSLTGFPAVNSDEGFNRQHLNEEAEELSTAENDANKPTSEESFTSGETVDTTTDNEEQPVDDIVDQNFDITDFLKELAVAVISATGEGEVKVVETSQLYANSDLTLEQSKIARDVVTIAREISKNEIEYEDGLKRIAGVIGVDYREIEKELSANTPDQHATNDGFVEEDWLGNLARKLAGAIGDDVDEYNRIADLIYPSKMTLKLSDEGNKRAKSIYNYGLQACKNEIPLDQAKKLMAGVARIDDTELLK